MATAPRQSKGGRKGPNDPSNQRRTTQAWGAPRPSGTYSAAASPARPAQPPPQQQQQQQQPAFPPLSHTNGTPRPDPSRDRVLQALTGLTGTTVTLITKPGQRYEGTVSSTSPEGDTPGVTLRNVKDISTPGAPLKDSVFVPATEIANYLSGPADAKFTNGDTFRTDTDISKKAGIRERDLQAWVPPTSDSTQPSGTPSGALGHDEETFGSTTNGTWDQFAANEQLFGVKAGFDENLYTTKLDRNAPDFKERERRAARIASEIMGTTTNNPHIAEERGLAVDDSGVNEEDKYGAVVRGQNAYIPPGARKAAAAAPAQPAPSEPSQPEIPKVSVNGPDGTTVQAAATPSSSKAASPAPAGIVAGAAQPNKPPADALPAFRSFVTNEMQRLTQKRQALAKSEMDKRMAELVKFSQEFKLNKPIPSDLVPILAKDEEKQKAIKEKAERDAQANNARAIGQATPARGVPVKPADSVRKPTSQVTSSSKNLNTQAISTPPIKTSSGAAGAGTPTAKLDTPAKKPHMVIQAIPPFRGAKKPAAPTPGNGSAVPLASGPGPNTNGRSVATANHGGNNNAPPVSPITANRLNVNASSFRPNPKANAFSPVAPSPSKANVPNAASQSVSPKPKQEAPQAPNPFFGTRPIKKGPPVHIKDDFNPFKHNKVVDASQVAALWPYNGKRYMLMFPAAPHPHPHPPPPHMVPPMPPPMAPPTGYDEDSAQAAARGFMYYPPYGYPQHMMPGMAPPGPPAGYMPAPYMQHMPYPPGMPPPNAMYSPAAMNPMPPPGTYIPPPPGAYPPPNGQGPRPSMPPTPIPAHAHPYYHQSPQLAHAYPMMMAPPPPPPASIPPHGYPDAGGAPPPPVPMGGHA